MSDTAKRDSVLAAYIQVETLLLSILNHFERRALLPANATSQDVQEAVALLFERLDKQDRILAALREPSEAVLVAAHKAYVKQPDPTTSAIRAAVAAAEQEVGRE